MRRYRLHARSGAGARRGRAAFTLIELLVVMAIMVILIGVAVTFSTAAFTRGKVRETQALLQKLELAARDFASDKPLAKVRGYRSRYGDYPPDELDGFIQGLGIPGSGQSLSSADLKIENELKDVAHPDIKAFALAVRLYSDKGAFVLDDVASRYRRAADDDPDDGDEEADEFLDRDGDGQLTPGDIPLDYFVDGWGVPIAYFSMSDGRPGTKPSGWDQTPNVKEEGMRTGASHAFLSVNNQVPVFVSYGPDGPDQFSDDFQDPATGFSPDLVFDLYNNEIDVNGKNVWILDHPMNEDNVYQTDTLTSRMNRAAFAPFDYGGNG